jgi:hypothetical protein
MKNAARFSTEGVEPFTDPTTGSGEIYLMPEGAGQDGRPFVFLVEDPPHKTRARHHHHGDVLYVYVRGEHHIAGEGTYRAGDLRWTRAGHVYGPETTGPEGGAWWVVSYSDPIPVDATEPSAASQTQATDAVDLPVFPRPYDWTAIDAAVLGDGGAILQGFLDAEGRRALNGAVDGYLARHPEVGRPASGSRAYDAFLGARTLRLHGLIDKAPPTADLIGHPDLTEWAARMMRGAAEGVLLNAGELIQIGAGEPAQYLHRDTDSWPAIARGEAPVLVNAIVALDPFTLENGATYVAPGSWRWEAGRQPRSDQLARAVMAAGDALLFRGDLVHGGGENASPAPRRAISVSYCAGWLRPVENSFLNIPLGTARRLDPRVQALLGYAAHDAAARRGGLLGLYENGDPARALAS